MRFSAPRLLAAMALLSIPMAAPAHRQWLLPSVTTVSGTDSWVTVDAAVSNDLFDPDHVAMPTEGIKIWHPDGTPGAIQNAARGRYRSTFDVQLDKPGTWKIGTFSTSVSGTFKLNGEDWTVGRRRGPPAGMGGPGMTGPGMAGPGGATRPNPAASGAPSAPPRTVATVEEIPAGATDLKLVESISRNEIFVTAGEPTTVVLKPSGQGLELDALTHPGDLVSNEPARFRFLIDGQPAAGIKVAAVPGGKRFREEEGAQELVTGADGVVEIRWPTAGCYWLNATATDARPATARATERRMSYTTTVEVPAP